MSKTQEAMPEPGKFTKEFREILRLENEGVEAFVPPSYQMGLEACDLIDRLTTENKRLAEGPRHSWCSYCTWETPDATLEDIKAHIESCQFHPLAKARAENKAQAERIAQLEKNQYPEAPLCSRCGRPQKSLGVLWEIHEGCCKP